MISQAWPHQQTAAASLGNAYRSDYLAPIVVAPTGFGKTHLAAMIILAVMQKGWRVLFLAHREELIGQCSAKLRESGIPHGIITSGRQPDVRHTVQVASVLTLINRLDAYKDFDLIVIDECHRSNAISYHKIVSHYQLVALRRDASDPAYSRPLRLLGLTATPTRLDNKGLGIHCGGLFDLIVPTVTPRELIDMGYLVPYRYLEGGHVDKQGVGTQAGDWNVKKAAERVDTAELRGGIVKHYELHGRDRPSLVFAQNVEHAERIALDFRNAGFSATAVSAESDKALRRSVLGDLATRQLQVAVNVGLWIEGMDCPPISYIGLGAMTQSVTRYLQSVGRGFRIDKDKPDLIIADHADCLEEHGYPCISRVWSLDGRPLIDKEQVAEYAIRRCPNKLCSAVHTARTRICDATLPSGKICGTLLVSVPVRQPRESDEELRENKRRFEEAVATERARKRGEVAKAKSREELLKLAADRGYSEGYVGHIETARAEKKALRDELTELRTAQGDSLDGLWDLKPKALKAEIEERLLVQAQEDETVAA